MIDAMIGGILIGVASSMLLLLNGKLAGISGILEVIVTKPGMEHVWKYLFLLGLLAGGYFLRLLHPGSFDYEIDFTVLEAVIGGFLVGFGARLGSGCTSGHGVCGLPRLSLRSLVAVACFMLSGMLTVFLKGVFS